MKGKQTMKLEIGDRITFCSATRWSTAKVTRKVNGFSGDGSPTVRYGGWSDFVVRPHEITAVQITE